MYKGPNIHTKQGYDPDQGVLINHIGSSSTPQAMALHRSA